MRFLIQLCSSWYDFEWHRVPHSMSFLFNFQRITTKQFLWYVSLARLPPTYVQLRRWLCEDEDQSQHTLTCDIAVSRVWRSYIRWVCFEMFVYGKNYVTTFVGLPVYLSISTSCHTKVNNVETSRVQHVSDRRLKFALRPHHVWKYGSHPICDGWD